MKWFFITLILCIYGFFKEFRPVEPFLTPYLLSPIKNFTDGQLEAQVYPFWTYSYLIVLIPTFILTDLLRYKPVIFFEGLTYAATWILLIWGTSVGHMQWMQVFYGFATATEVAYYAYIFAAVDSTHYKKATSYVKGATELGHFFAYALSQLLIHFYPENYQLLNYISLASCILIVPIAICLPWISYKKPLQKSSIEKPVENSPIIHKEVPTSYLEFVKKYFLNLWSNFKRIYSSTFMWKWSLWWALATCGFFQIGNFVQNLWAEIQPSGGERMNGVVEAVNTFAACVIVFLMQFVTVQWEIWGELTLAVASAVDCVLLVLMSQSYIIELMYAFYILFTLIYQMMFTIGMYNIAKRLTTESYGLVFGFNTFIALALQTALTFAVADESGLALKIRPQFAVYGGYYGCIAILFAVMGAYTLFVHFQCCMCKRRTWNVETESSTDRDSGGDFKRVHQH